MNPHISNKPRICFVALTAYPLLSGRNLGHVIGPDVHQVLLANELLKHGYEVSFITHNEGGPPLECINGIEIIKTFGVVNRPNLALKAFHIWKAMRKAKADIYFQQGGTGGVASLFCRLHRKRFVLSIGSDAHVSKEVKDFGLIDRLGARLDIKLAHVITAQTEFQRAMLRMHFGKDSVLVRNPFPVTKRGLPEKAKPPIVLWVGAMADVKQPELFLQLARAIPEATFQMIGGSSLASAQQVDTHKKILDGSKTVSNFEALGFIPFDDVGQYFSRAEILVNTSKFEGFPNAFVQAWMNYVPIVSLNADPDELICNNRMGFHSKTFSQLVKDVKTLLENEQLRHQMGENGRRYVEKEHDITKIVEKYVEILDQKTGL